MTKRILVVEDDAALARVLTDNLQFEGFETMHVADGRLAIDAARSMAPDLVLLDITLPGINGLRLCSMWREQLGTPIILLTAKALKVDKLKGLHAGADDYITKPFDLDELMARIRAVLRRARPAIDRLTIGDVEVDFLRQQATRRGRPLDLTHREMTLLRYLAERAGSVVHRDVLLHELWGFPYAAHTRAVDNVVARLRRKIEPDPHQPQFIRTVHGDGYSMAPSALSE